jgi:hypothetical protein
MPAFVVVEVEVIDRKGVRDLQADCAGYPGALRRAFHRKGRQDRNAGRRLASRTFCNFGISVSGESESLDRFAGIRSGR